MERGRLKDRRLTPEIVRGIKRLISEGVPRQEIAKRFGVTYITIYRIATGKTWKDLDV